MIYDFVQKYSAICFRRFSLLGLIILSVPFLHIFGPIRGLSVPLLVGSCVVFGFLVVRRFRCRLPFAIEDVFLLFMVFLGVFLIDYSTLAAKNIFHSGLWMATLGVFYFGTKVLVVNTNVTASQLKFFFFLALCVTSVGVTADFYTANFLGYYLSDILPYNMGEMKLTKNFSKLLFRARGFAAEPGFTAMVYEMLLPLGILYCRKCPAALILLPWIFACYLILTSAASLAGLALCLPMLFVALKFRQVVWLVIAMLVITLLFLAEIQHYLEHSIGIKISLWLSGESVRYKIYESLLPVIANNPAGIGFGSLSQAYAQTGHFGGVRLIGAGAINLYLEIAVFSGLLGIASFLIFLARHSYRFWSLSKTPEVYALGFSFVWLAFHHALLTEYYFPMLWMVLALLGTWTYVHPGQAPSDAPVSGDPM